MTSSNIDSSDSPDSNTLKVLVLVLLVIGIQFLVKVLFGKKIEKDGDMKTSKDYHMIRRFQHMMTGLGMLVIYEIFSEELTTYGILAGAILFLGVNLLRKIIPSLNDMYLKNFGFILRPHEINNMPGAVYFLWGVACTKIFFPRPIVILSVIILSFGDPCASLFGIYFQSPKITKNKTIAGTLGCALVSTLIILAYPYTFLDAFSPIRQSVSTFEFTIVSFLVAGFAEIVPTSRRFYMDDNFSIPIFSAILFKLWFNYRGL